MKELSIEEKARRYDKAIEIAKDINNEQRAQPFNVMTRVFPELKENEDEKTKRILHSISSKMSFHLRDIFTEEEFHCFDTWSYVWLNKQSEKKESYIDISLVDAVRFCVADNLAHTSTDDNGNTIGFGVYIDDTTANKLTNELSDIFQKPIEWSEEEKKKIDNILNVLIDYKELEPEYFWLKSLRPQSHRKPSDEQMEYLAKAITTLGNEGDNKTSAILYELRKDLKNLKG